MKAAPQASEPPRSSPPALEHGTAERGPGRGQALVALQAARPPAGHHHRPHDRSHMHGAISYILLVLMYLSAGPVMGQGPGLYTLDINSKAGEGIFVTYFQVRLIIYCH